MYVFLSLLRYLASGNTLADLYYTYRIGVSTLSDIIQSVCTSIWTVLKNESIPQPTTERLMEIAEKFEENANFPNCFGSVDGKHVRVIKPQHSGSLCFNYKEYFSVVLMAVADSQYKFVYVDIGSYGKDSDPTVFSNSTFWKAIVSGELKLPESKHLPNDGGVTVPYVLVGDEAFGLHPNLMRPFGGKMLSVQKRVFNYRLTRARRFVECTFGILTNKWRIFHRPLNVSLDFATKIIQACCVLHNFVRDRDGYAFEDTLSVAGFQDCDAERQNQRGGLQATNIRQKFAEYFMSEQGSLPWQMSKI